MRAVLWSDYLCPWCYLGRDRTALLGDLGVEVTALPYELHPDLPRAGRSVATGGRLADVYARIGAECAEVDMLFVAPTRIPNTRAALETAELVRRHAPAAFEHLDRLLFEAVFAGGDGDIDDEVTLDRLVTAAGAPQVEISQRRQQGEGADALAEARNAAQEAGVTGTPAWFLDDRLLIPGVQPRELIERWVRRIASRPAEVAPLTS